MIRNRSNHTTTTTTTTTIDLFDDNDDYDNTDDNEDDDDFAIYDDDDTMNDDFVEEDIDDDAHLLLPRYNNKSSSSSSSSNSNSNSNSSSNDGNGRRRRIDILGCVLAFIPAFIDGLLHRRPSHYQKNNKGHNKEDNDKKAATTIAIKNLCCTFILILLLGLYTIFFICFSSVSSSVQTVQVQIQQQQPQPQPQPQPGIHTIDLSKSKSTTKTKNTIVDDDNNSSIENQTQTKTQNLNQRYNPTTTTTTTTIYRLPNNNDDDNNDYDIESQLLNHYERDQTWYKSCLYDNSTLWISNTRNSGHAAAMNFNRACSTSGLHPIGTHYNPFETSSHTCKITTSIDIIRSTTTTTTTNQKKYDESWIIQTYDKNKTPKVIGGDTFYIVYEEYYYETTNMKDGNISKLQQSSIPIPIPLAVGKLIDYYNGTYGIENFYSIPFFSSTDKTVVSKKYGRLIVYPISTCFIGELYPPLKDEWNTGGSTGNITWSTSTSASTNASKSASTMSTTSTSTMSTSSEGNNDDNDGVNVVNDVIVVNRPSKILDPISSNSNSNSNTNSNMILPNLKQYNRTIFFGDSIIRQMIYNIFQKQYYHHQSMDDELKSLIGDNNIWVGNNETTPKDPDDGGPINVNMPLSPETLQDYIQVMELSISDGLLIPNNNNATSENYKISLVLGSSAWDIIWPKEWQGPTFDNHLTALRDLIKYIRMKYPHIYIIWKLPYANAMYKANPVSCFNRWTDNGSCVTALRYSSIERFYYLYQKQKYLLTQDKQYNFWNDKMISVIDLYDISYVSGIQWMIPNDSLHYLPIWNLNILQLLYS